jgi:hypothetical protein
MAQSCEMCAGLFPDLRPSRSSKRLRRLLVDGRILSLCDVHARRVHESGAETAAELRALFLEPGGKRSLIDRRAPLDRRLFPARPEGRRRAGGRRRDDDAA